MLQRATPDDDPNQMIEPPKPTAYARRPQSYPPCLIANAVSGMLSKTADRNPRPRLVFHEGTGNVSTGIIEAINTSDSRKIEPRSAGRNPSQSGARNKVETRIATQTATPINGKLSAYPGNL